MSIKNRKNFTKLEVEDAIEKTNSMGGAAKYLKVDWRTFKWNAELYGLYKPDPTLGIREKIPLDAILAGLYPSYHTSHLSKRLIKEGKKEYVCEGCNLFEWRGERLSLELNHKDGDNSNHRSENLELLCPNCHSITPTFRNKRGKERPLEKFWKVSVGGPTPALEKR